MPLVRPAAAGLHVSLWASAVPLRPRSEPDAEPGYAYAPVVQAQPGASDHSLAKAFVQAVGKAVGEGANEAMFGGGQSVIAC